MSNLFASEVQGYVAMTSSWLPTCLENRVPHVCRSFLLSPLSFTPSCPCRETRLYASRIFPCIAEIRHLGLSHSQPEEDLKASGFLPCSDTDSLVYDSQPSSGYEHISVADSWVGRPSERRIGVSKIHPTIAVLVVQRSHPKSLFCNASYSPTTAADMNRSRHRW
jgi:hypothetical protein